MELGAQTHPGEAKPDYSLLALGIFHADLLCMSPLDLLADTVLLASPLAKLMATSSRYSIVLASGVFSPGPGESREHSTSYP